MIRLSKDESFSKMNIILIAAALMILIGVLVPLFGWLVDKTKISEVKENLAAICAAQESYRATHGAYHPCKESPASGGTDGIPDPWVDKGTSGIDAFADIGFKPKGPVRYRYAVIRPTEVNFMAIAIGDLDADGESAVFTVIRTHPKYPKPVRSGDRW